jgi:hypothetical protein
VRNMFDATMQTLGYALLTGVTVWAIIAYVP